MYRIRKLLWGSYNKSRKPTAKKGLGATGLGTWFRLSYVGQPFFVASVAQIIDKSMLKVQHCFILCRFIQSPLQIYLSIVGAIDVLPLPISLVLSQEFWAVLMREGDLMFFQICLSSVFLTSGKPDLMKLACGSKCKETRGFLFSYPQPLLMWKPNQCFMCKWDSHMKYEITQVLLSHVLWLPSTGLWWNNGLYVLTLVPLLYMQCRNHT